MAAPDIGALWDRLDAEEKQLLLEKRRLQEIWLKIADMHRTNEEERAELEAEAGMAFMPADTRIVLNVGGQLFETTAETLCKDRYSLLAALCLEDPGPPVEPRSRPEGAGRAFFIERDWWTFNPILHFLRTGALPGDVRLLEEMYAEASFYRLNSLRVAIEASARHAAEEAPPRGREWETAPAAGTGRAYGGAARAHGGAAAGSYRRSVSLDDPHSFTSGGPW